jgi:3-phosphoshikimate 1-carboxyvinyltransferase
MVNAIHYFASPVSRLVGNIKLPGDKSISHRALLLSAIAEGTSYIHNLLMGEDNLATLAALRHLGVNIQIENQTIVVTGKGLKNLQKSDTALNLGNSGTGFRLLAGILAGQTFSSELIGDESLQKRPMARIVDPLRQMGAKIEMSSQGTPPLLIHGSQQLKGITYEMPMASAQVKSCLLLAGLYAKGSTVIIEPSLSRDHTERMLQQFGYPITIYNNTVGIEGGHSLRATKLMIPGDISSAAFFIVAAAIVPGSELCLKQVGINPTRIGILKILQLMGADITLQHESYDEPEPTADILIRYRPLTGITIPHEEVVSAIDEFPIIFIAAACARGKTVLRGARELRVKESDRIKTMADGLSQVGIHTEVLDDGLIVHGGPITGGKINSEGDHRIAMAFAVAGCVAKETLTILNCNNVSTSFPNFVELAEEVGMNLRVTHS